MRKRKLIIIVLIVSACFYFYSLVRVQTGIGTFVQYPLEELLKPDTDINLRIGVFELDNQSDKGAWTALSHPLIPFNIITRNVLLIKFSDNRTYIFTKYVFWDIENTIPGIMGLDWLNTTMGWIMYSSGIEECYINNEKIFLLIKKRKHLSQQEFIEIIKMSFSNYDVVY